MSSKESGANDFWGSLKKVLGLSQEDAESETSTDVVEEKPKSILKESRKLQLSPPIMLFCKDADGHEKGKQIKITGDLAFEDVLDILHNEFGRACFPQYTDELGNTKRVETDRDFLDMCEAYEDEGKLDVLIKNANWVMDKGAKCFMPRPAGPGAVVK